jgi:hypothetical protein
MVQVTLRWPSLRVTSLVQTTLKMRMVPRIGERVYLSLAGESNSLRFTVTNVEHRVVERVNLSTLTGWIFGRVSRRSTILVRLQPDLHLLAETSVKQTKVENPRPDPEPLSAIDRLLETET